MKKVKIISKSKKGAANEYGAYVEGRGKKPPKRLSVSKGRKLIKGYKVYTVKKG